MVLERRPPDLQYPLVKVTLLYRKQATSVEPPTRVASSCNRVLVPSTREGACSNWGRRGAAQTTGPVQQLEQHRQQQQHRQHQQKSTSPSQPSLVTTQATARPITEKKTPPTCTQHRERNLGGVGGCVKHGRLPVAVHVDIRKHHKGAAHVQQACTGDVAKCTDGGGHLQAEPRSHTPRVGQGDQGVLGQRLGCNKGALQVLPAARQQGEVGESRRETERETEREKERLRESERKRVQREERERERDTIGKRPEDSEDLKKFMFSQTSLTVLTGLLRL
jgi:hypothetical protein